MKKVLKILVLIILVGIIAIQFFQPEKNIEELNENHILKHEKISENVKEILTNACLDCHSNNTDYKWFHHTVPVAWMINKHIIEGKDELNLSEWGKMDIFDKMDALDEMCEEVEKGEMPLKSYTAIHSDARLSEEDKKVLCDWTEKLAEELMSKAIN